MAQGDLRLYNTDDSYYTGFQSSDALGADLIYTLPSAQAGDTGYALTNNGSGVLSWTDLGGTGGSAGAWTLTDDDLYPDQTTYNVAIGATNAGSAKLYIDGNVGIGTTDPQSSLHVYNGASGQSTPHSYSGLVVACNTSKLLCICGHCV